MRPPLRLSNKVSVSPNPLGWSTSTTLPSLRRTSLVGDIDGNGKVNNRDLGLLQQYINDWNAEVDLSACDVNGDGVVNNRDLGLLQQTLNG